MMNATLMLHEDICPGVRQPQANQAPTNKDGRSHEYRDGFGNADERPKYKVP